MNPQPKNPSPLSSPYLPWRIRIALYIASKITDASLRQNNTINRRILHFLHFKSPASPSTPINNVTSSDIPVDSTRNLWFRLYNPTSTTTPLPIMIFFHGGGFISLSADYKPYDSMCRHFARNINAIVVSVNYRLVPEYKCPAQYDDGFDVLKFLDDEENGGRVLPENADLSCCFLVGDSAGGNIAHHVAKRACQYEFMKLKVIGVVAIQPFFGGEERTEAEIRLNGVDPLINTKRNDWIWKNFVPLHEGADRDHEVIHVSGPKAVDISKLNFPMVMVVIGGFDLLQAWQKRYCEWLKKSGKEVYLVEYPNMVHGFYVFPEFDETTMLIYDVKKFIYNQHSSCTQK